MICVLVHQMFGETGINKNRPNNWPNKAVTVEKRRADLQLGIVQAIASIHLKVK